jgi:glycosyltransferase involved in cell wall biosynthesis
MPNRRLAGRADGHLHPEYRGKYFTEEDWRGIRVLRSWAYASKKKSFLRTMVNNASFMTTSAAHALARLGRPDVLIASSPPFLPHVAGATVARVQRIPLVLEIRDLWPDYLVGLGMLKPNSVAARSLFQLERLLLRRAAHVVVVTDSFRKRIIEKGVAPERVSVISNGVDTSNYRPEKTDPPIPALERKGPGGEFVVGYLGTFGAGQALSSVVDAAAMLADEATDIKLVLVGEGPDWNRVKERAASLGLTNLVVERSIDRSTTRAFYNSLDLCLVPLAPIEIFQETVPSKIFEIMACGRPVLASLRGEAATIVQSSGGGETVAPGDSRAIADGIKRIRSMTPSARLAMGERGRIHVRDNYQREVLADRYLEILGRVAAASSRPRHRPAKTESLR